MMMGTLRLRGIHQVLLNIYSNNGRLRKLVPQVLQEYACATTAVNNNLRPEGDGLLNKLSKQSVTALKLLKQPVVVACDITHFF